LILTFVFLLVILAPPHKQELGAIAGVLPLVLSLTLIPPDQYSCHQTPR